MMKRLEKRARHALKWYERRREEGDEEGAEWAMARMRKAISAMSELVMGGCKDLLIV